MSLARVETRRRDSCIRHRSVSLKLSLHAPVAGRSYIHERPNTSMTDFESASNEQIRMDWWVFQREQVQVSTVQHITREPTTLSGDVSVYVALEHVGETQHA